MDIDPSQLKPIPIQTTLLFVNNFIVNTTKFLNTFSESCDIKLSNISSKINNLDIVLSVLEAKLNSVPGLETDDIPMPTSSATASSQNTTEPTTAQSAQQESGGGGGGGASDMVKASEHPAYAPFFKLSKLGVPMPVVSAKTAAAGLDPSVLEDPEAMISLSGGGGGGGGGGAPTAQQQQQQQETPPAATSTSNEGLIKASEHPDYAPFFKLTKLGVPIPVVSGKVSAAGLDPSVLENPDAMISSGPAEGGGQLVVSGGGGGGGGAVAVQPVSRRIFNKYDSGGSGHISTGQFQAMALDFGVFLSGNALSLAVKMIDHDGNGTIEYEEFLNWYKQSSFSSLSLDDQTLERRSSAAKLFRKYDDDNSGIIEVAEFKGLYTELKMLNLTKHSCEKAMEDMDSDGDGKIEFNEFVEWIDRHCE